jgi:hypothetical protein
MAPAEHKTPTLKGKLIFWAICAGCGPILAGIAYAVLSLSSAGTYLPMQALSDPLHRLVLIGLPVAAGLLALVWTLSELGRLGAWFRIAGRGLTAFSLAFATCAPVAVLLFDLRLEAQGLEGELMAGAGVLEPSSIRGLQGSFCEKSALEPNLVIEGLASGDMLTLDRRTLARKRSDGSFAWHLPRPGPPPACLVLDRGLAFYTGPGPQFEDDVVAAGVQLETGMLSWTLHGLGNAASPMAVEGNRAAFASWRPSTSAVRLIDLRGSRQEWARRLRGSIGLAPRFDGPALKVALDGFVLELDPATGAETRRSAACLAPQRHGVACKAERVVAWLQGEAN